MPLELFLDLLSQPCRSVYIFAKKNNIPHEFKKISLMEEDHYGEEFGKVNPMRKVPAIRDGDFCLSESVAILMYMVDKYKTDDHWYPADLQKRARVNEYLAWQPMGIRMHGSKIFWINIMVPKIMGRGVPEDKKKAAIDDLNGSLKMIEEKFLQDRPFIAGDQISLADLVAIVEVYQPVGGGIDVFEGRPKLSAWRDRVRQEVGPALFDEVHKRILGAQEMVKGLDASKMAASKRRFLAMFF
ncbi:glutathione S-transferase theta-3-like [Engraulis encrasicolus]|uniref:glutathione S-transferase theta-3-like n=1 Tax=Engraulis encrasicolus TaxID=184585 RepID=UPI002FD61397